jgi:peptide-methionine (S)-S-oxide reductase
MFNFFRTPTGIPQSEDCLSGRSTPIVTSSEHYVNGNTIVPPFPAGLETLVIGMGCFWGAERIFWQTPGVYTTAAGYSGGITPNPTYEETCTGMTGHAESVLIVFDPKICSIENLLKLFWENHDPTQYMGQGNDIGTQYRSAIYTNGEQQKEVSDQSRLHYQSRLSQEDFGEITTEIVGLKEFYYAEEYHQQYLAKIPNGYCNHGFCQVSYEG